MPSVQGWQFPQGGVDPRADLVAEARRELREEIGTDDIRVLRITRRTYCYDLPHKLVKHGREYDGQCLRWILAAFDAQDCDIRFAHEPAEFDAWEWVEPGEALSRVVAFKREAYVGAMGELGILGKAQT